MPSCLSSAALVVALAACGSSSSSSPGPAAPGAAAEDGMMASAAAPPAAGGDAESTYGPLDVGADYATYRKLTDAPFLSTVHGGRWVDVYVNELGAQAYLTDSADIPVGTIVVKTSLEPDGDHAGTTPGPIFVMEKRAPGYAPDHGDWYYAIHWADPTPAMRKVVGGPIYWRGASPRAAYCVDCHDGYDRSLGGLTPSSQLPR